MRKSIEKYVLENDSIVEVHKVFGDEYYLAIVDLNGNYPAKGKIAHDLNRYEYLHILEGEIEININERKLTLKKGENILINNNDRYSIFGKGKILVFVKDEENGQSKIEEA